MKKFLIMIFVGIIFAAANVFASSYVGNINSNIFHYSDCHSVGKMNPNNKIIFNSREEAIQHGYRPCKKCSP